MSEKVVTSGKKELRARISYAKIFKAEEDAFGNMKYSCAILIPKTDKETVKKFKAAIKAETTRGIEEVQNWKGKVPKNLKGGMKDGDGEMPEGGTYDASCHGHYVINANCKDDSTFSVVGTQRDADGKWVKLTDPRDCVSGDYCRFSINVSAYGVSGNNGVGMYLNNIQMLGKGEPLGGSGPAAEEDFEDVDVEEEDDWMDDE